MFFSRARSYRPVIILSRARSGSNLLRFLLYGHHQIVMHGEVFHGSPRVQRTQWRTRPNFYLGDHEDAVAYLHTRVFPYDGEGARVVGFKLFPHQLWCKPAFAGLYDALNGMKDLVIIDLVRENLLDTVLSLAMAKRDNLFLQTQPDAALQERMIAMEPSQWMEMMRTAQKELKDNEEAYPGHERYGITYRQLITDPAATVEGIHRWVGVDPHPLTLSQRIVRQRTVHKRHVLANYAELRSLCERDYPQWLWMFDDDDSDIEVSVPVRPPLALSAVA